MNSVIDKYNFSCATLNSDKDKIQIPYKKTILLHVSTDMPDLKSFFPPQV